MVKIVRLEANIAVSSQLVEADFEEVAAGGFRSVVNNRPDGEASGQMPNAQAEAAAGRHGLEFRHQPVANLNVTDEAVVEDFARLLNDLPGPILFYCRSGTRCTALWAQASVGRLGVARTLEIAAKAGYDLEVLRDRLEERAGEAGSTTIATTPQRTAVSPPSAI